MSISVVIPAYRAARTICRAVDSVLRQTLSAWEILVVDDGSPDREELRSILKSYGDRVRHLEKPNGGVASARNLGVDVATGEWIAFLDADDFWEPAKLARQYAIAQQYPEVSIIGCRWYNQTPGRPPEPDRAKTASFAGRVLSVHGAEAFQVAMCVWTCSLMIRRTLLQQRFVSELEPAEDRDLWFRLLNEHQAYICPELLATYVQEPGGISRVNVDRDCSRMLAMIQRHAAAIGTAEATRHAAVAYRRWAAEHLGSGRPLRAISPACKRLRLEPWLPQAWWIVFKSGYRGVLTTAIQPFRNRNTMQTIDTVN